MSSCAALFQYAAPLVPAIVRWFFMVRFESLLRVRLTEAELDRDNHRAHILALAGFTFAGLIALVVLDVSNVSAFQFAIYDLFVSFVGFTSALSLQHYKSTRGQDQLGTALADVGAFGQYLAVLNLVVLSHLPPPLIGALFVVALGAWLADYWVRLLIEMRHFARLAEGSHDGRQERS